MILISLVGEQPLPILLPALHLNPSHNILIHTDLTEPVAHRLQTVMENSTCHLLKADLHDIEGIAEEIESLIHAARPMLTDRGTGNNEEQEIVLNPTGAKKVMAFGMLVQTLRAGGSFIYLESEKRVNTLYSYKLIDGTFKSKEPPVVLHDLLDLETYLKSSVKSHKIREVQKGKENLFEVVVEEALKSSDIDYLPRVCPDGINGQLEIDFVVRLGNQVGILELKSGKNSPKQGLDQLAMAGGKDYLGTYTAKFLVVTQELEEKVKNVRPLAKARHIEIITIPDYVPGQPLSKESRKELLEKLRKNLSKQ